ncbi:sugar phosphate isomerase/epimerase family protein [Enterococcus sp. AZ109]|uniref:sugar phosphate isomerase/epimerase family protein n=1 Tax=Enterococcus sp. AZ109 TaxID=2774634 RepID=UPI003F268E2E
MLLGFNEATCMNNSTLENDLALCEKYNYDYIEIRLDMLADYLQTHSLQDLKEFFEKSHLKPFGFNSIEDINFCTPIEWKNRLDLIKFACEASEVIGAKTLVVVPTMGAEMKNKSKSEIFDDSVKVLRTLSDFVEPYGMRLAFEPIGDKRWAVGSLQEALDIVEAVDRENVGLALDSFNLYLHNKLKDIDTIDKLPLEKIFLYHIDDCEDLPLGIVDHYHRLFPGDGVIPVAELSKKLKAKGYEGICSLELFNPAYYAMKADDVVRIGAEKSQPYL